MGPVPEDLIVFLLFGAFVLVQILRSRRRSKARRAKVEPVVATPAEMQTQTEPQAETPVSSQWTPTLVEGPRQRAAAQPPSEPAPVRPPTRRFSRRALMGDRRSLQDAIVVATILGPCRAKRPHDME
jgi:hypothetical protein